MQLKLEWFKPECLSSWEQEPTLVDSAVKELNSVLLNDYYWKLNTETWELRLRDFTLRKLAPVVEEKIVKILEAMDVKSDKIATTKQELQKLLSKLK